MRPAGGHLPLNEDNYVMFIVLPVLTWIRHCSDCDNEMKKNKNSIAKVESREPRLTTVIELRIPSDPLFKANPNPQTHIVLYVTSYRDTNVSEFLLNFQ